MADRSKQARLLSLAIKANTGGLSEAEQKEFKRLREVTPLEGDASVEAERQKMPKSSRQRKARQSISKAFK